MKIDIHETGHLQKYVIIFPKQIPKFHCKCYWLKELTNTFCSILRHSHIMFLYNSYELVTACFSYNIWINDAAIQI